MTSEALSHASRNFWARVDSSGPGWRWAEWSEERAKGCVATNSWGERCRQALYCDGAPFCEFHGERAMRAFVGALEDEQAEVVRQIQARVERASGEHLRVLERSLRTQLGIEAAQVRRAKEVLAGDSSCVYFFADREEWQWVKIGYSKNVESRLTSFRRGRGCMFPPEVDPSRGVLLGTIPGGQPVEARIHAELGGGDVGEWFRRTPLVERVVYVALSGD